MLSTGMSGEHSIRVGIVYETFATHPLREGDPADAHAEYEPEATIETLEAAIAELGHRPLRLGSPQQLLARLQPGTGLEIDAALTIAEGHGSRNREAWAPVLLELAGVPTLGSDALTLSLSLDKAWANQLLRAGGVPVAPQCTMDSEQQALEAELPAAFPCS